MKVKEILNRLKANKNTYYNLTAKDKKDYQRLYNHLKRNKERQIRSNVFQYNDAVMGQFEYWLSNVNELEYLRKYKAMELISYNLK